MQIQGRIHLMVPPTTVYDTWMNGTQHSLMAEGVAVIDPKVGGQFSLWGGSVTGEFVYLRRPDRIVFTWRTEDFGFGDADRHGLDGLDGAPRKPLDAVEAVHPQGLRGVRTDAGNQGEGRAHALSP